MMGLAQMACELANARCGQPGAISTAAPRLPVPRAELRFDGRHAPFFPVSTTYYAIIDHVEVAMSAYRFLQRTYHGCVGPIKVVL